MSDKSFKGLKHYVKDLVEKNELLGRARDAWSELSPQRKDTVRYGLALGLCATAGLALGHMMYLESVRPPYVATEFNQSIDSVWREGDVYYAKIWDTMRNMPTTREWCLGANEELARKAAELIPSDSAFGETWRMVEIDHILGKGVPDTQGCARGIDNVLDIRPKPPFEFPEIKFSGKAGVAP